jgi:PhzF family phenazine biosynthesis protein
MSWQRLPFTQVDAFSDKSFGGNPAAVIPLAEWLSDSVLLAIAAENNLSETAFLVADEGEDADYELRWFTPEVEIPLCGHATLASAHMLLSSAQWRSDMRFRTRKNGVLTVRRDEDELYHLSLPAFRPAPADLPQIVEALGVSPLETLIAKDHYVLIVLRSAADIRAITPDIAALKALGDYQIIVTARGDGDPSGAEVVSRVFVPAAGIAEDPVTGSAHCVLTPYWTARFGKDSFTAYQASKRGGHIGCTMIGGRAELSGRCVTVISGEFHL